MKSKWNEYIRLAKIYYKHYGNLMIPSYFKTKNGIDYDENGEKLGSWIVTKRRAYYHKNSFNLTKKQVKELESIGMVFENTYNAKRELEWDNYYELARSYYNHYGNLFISKNFKTLNGYEYNDNGACLGYWLRSQKKALQDIGNYKISDEHKKMLQNIGMTIEESDINEYKWNKIYELAKIYYEHHGDLLIQARFKTINGYEYDENGINLGYWISTQRRAYHLLDNHKLTDDQIRKLDNISMSWYLNEYFYNKSLKEEITNINKLQKYKELSNRLKSYLNKFDGNILPTKEEINNAFLNDFDNPNIKKDSIVNKKKSLYKVFSLDWENYFNLASIYYEVYGNLNIPINFKTKNGYEYDITGARLGYWISTQRRACIDHKIEIEKKQKLESIGMVFENTYNVKR